MERQFQFDDLRYCKRAVNAVLVGLDDELDRCTFEYNFYGETQIIYNTFSTCLTSLVIRDFHTFNTYVEYLEGRIMYLKELLKEIQAQLDKGKETFDPNKLDRDIWRVWDIAMEE